MEGRRSTATISFSLDLETLNYLEAYSQINRVTRSSAIRYHVRMGRVYLKQLEEQLETVENAEHNGIPQ